MARTRKINSNCVWHIDISVEDRIARYDAVIEAIKSSPDKINQYLVSTGIYTPTGRLKKIYK